MSDTDGDTTGNGLDYESETASLTGDDKRNIEECINNHFRLVTSLRQQTLELPETVSVLECMNGTKVYLVGTAHFSKESIDEVKKIVSQTHPDFLVLELCSNRTRVLVSDDEKIKQEAKEIDILTHIKMSGLSHGLLQYLMLRLNLYLINTLGMSPGGEFRAAAQEAMKQPHCHIVLGDRPISITLQRAFNSLGPWTKIKLGFSLLFDLEPITAEQIEEMKKSDFLERIIMEMAGEHPELTRILLEERDMYLAKSIWATTGMNSYHQAKSKDDCIDDNSTKLPSDNVRHTDVRLRSAADVGDSQPTDFSSDREESVNPTNRIFATSEQTPPCCSFWPSPSVLPRVVVAVVGIGHVAGIKRYWANADSINQHQLMTVMEPPLSWKLFRWSLRILLLSTVLGIGYGAVRGSYKLGSTIWQLFR
ncbi:traB domain-containing protein [Clonorchis sinensis]|uniref:TraB domain-containing protein n=1 Tax=Clonorchis sinensis TaxID=79923 RepID=G7Y9H9_CLOSI|nr:traB domain-containing protein [Clonorchis sinensis]